MSINAAESNLSGYLFKSTESGTLPVGLGSNVLNAFTTARDSEDVNCFGPRTATIMAKIASGDLTVKVSVHAGTPNFGSPDLTLTLSDTDPQFGTVKTTASKPFVSLRLLSTAGCTVTPFGLQIAKLLDTDESYHESAMGMLSNSGSGSYDLAVL